MKTIVAILIGAAVGTSAAHGTGCRVVRSQVVQQVIVEPVAIAYYQPVVVGAYTVGYADQSASIVEELRALRLELQAQLQALRQGREGVAENLKPEPAFVGLVRQNCAACHGTTPKGNKMSLFHPDGNWKEPSPELLGDIIARVSNGSMPKDRKMDADARLRLIAGLTSAPEAAKAPEKAPPPK